MLKSLSLTQVEDMQQGRDMEGINTPPPVVCENCGTTVPRQDQAINLMIAVGSPGHPELAPFQCPGGGHSLGDHWACSIECWGKIAHACIDEHMTEFLKALHQQKGINLEWKETTH